MPFIAAAPVREWPESGPRLMDEKQAAALRQKFATRPAEESAEVRRERLQKLFSDEKTAPLTPEAQAARLKALQALFAKDKEVRSKTAEELRQMLQAKDKPDAERQQDQTQSLTPGRSRGRGR